MSYTQSPSRQSRRTPSRPPSAPVLVAPVPQYPLIPKILDKDMNSSNVGMSQANPLEQQSGYPQGQPTMAFFDQQAGYHTTSGQFSPSGNAGMAQGASPSNRPGSTRHSPALYPDVAENPDHNPPALSASPSSRPRSTRHSPAPYPYAAGSPGRNPYAPSGNLPNYQTHLPSELPPIDAPRRQSSRNSQSRTHAATERTSNVPIPIPEEQTAEDASAELIELFSPGTSRPRRHKREPVVSTPRRRSHRYEDPQAVALSHGLQSTPPAVYHGPVGTSNVHIYNMDRPTFNYQYKEEDKAESSAPTKKTGGFFKRVGWTKK